MVYLSFRNSQTLHLTYPMKFLMKQLTATSERSFRKNSGFIIGKADDISRLQLGLSFMPLSLNGAMFCMYTLLQQLKTVAFIFRLRVVVLPFQEEANQPKSKSSRLRVLKNVRCACLLFCYVYPVHIYLN